MKYQVLGPLEVDAGAGPLPLAGKPQALMALLLLHANETLSADRIAEDLACETVEDLVSRLRQILPDDVLETHWGGYRLRVPDGALDLQRFEVLAREAGQAEPAGAARLLREALALWRGPPLAGMREPFARGEAARLEDLRVSVYDARLEAERAGGLERHPQRERFMLSLYRASGLNTLRAVLAGGRLLTLTGPGGSGKTRLARDLARAAAPEFPGGVHFVSLEAVADPDLVATTILLALGVRQERRRLDALVAEFRDSRALLVLDHFDHVREAAMDMAVLLRRTRDLTLLVTARKPLGVQDEREWPVTPQARPPLAPIHARLPEPERRAFAQLAVYVGGAAPDAVPGASALLARGLVQLDGAGRYTMAPTVREYAVAQLEARGETEAAAEALAAYVCALAQAGGAGVRGAGEPDWSERLERELPNVRAAVAWMLLRGRHADVLDALIALTPFLWRFGHTREGARWFGAVLAEPGLDAELRRRGQAAAATLLWASNADPAEAERLALATLETPAEPDDLFAAAARGVISLVAEARGDVARALDLATEVEATFRRRGDHWHALVSSICVSRILATSGHPDPERTARNLAEARSGGRYLLAVALVDAGLLALRNGSARGARVALMEALVVADAIGNPIARARGLMALAAVELAEEDAVRAATLLGAADAIRRSIGHVPPAGDAARQKELVAAGTRALGDAGFTQAWRQGQALSTRAAVAFALD